MIRRFIALTAVVTTAITCLAAATSSSAATLTRGFVDDVWFTGYPSQNAAWVQKTVATGAKIVQLEVDWTTVEPNRPVPPDNPTSPSSPQYNFGYLDQRLEAFARTGIQPLIMITDAPRWAQGAGGSRSQYAAGEYKPNAKAFGQLAAAIAKRYSGSYPDPLHAGTKLPRVRYFQAWAEAELGDGHLAPQWTRHKGHWVNTGATIYRGMLNSFYAGIKSGDRSAIVVSSGFSSYGDPPGGLRTHPVTFLENLLCLNAKLKRVCNHTTHFDILADDPYEVGSPTTPAYSSLDASAPDLGRMTRVARAALRAHTLLPGGRKPLWVTEFGYDSKPPNPTGLPVATQARWLEESFYVFWKEGVSTAFWYLVRDQLPPYNVNYFSGVYFHNGTRKPAFEAYRFPLVVMKATRQHAQIWGISPQNGTVKVERQVHGSWKTVATFKRSPGALFHKMISVKLTGSYRATVNGEISLVWKY